MRNYIRFYNTIVTWASTGGNFTTNCVAQNLDEVAEAVYYTAAFFNVDLSTFVPQLGDFRETYLKLDHENLWKMLVYNNGFWEDGVSVPFGSYPWITYDSPRKTWSHGH